MSWLVRITASTSEPRFIRCRLGRASRPTNGLEVGGVRVAGTGVEVAEDIGRTRLPQSTIRKRKLPPVTIRRQPPVCKSVSRSAKSPPGRGIIERWQASRPRSRSQRRPRPRPMRADARRNYQRLLGGRPGGAHRARQRGLDGGDRQAADVGVGTLYRHFPRRIDLVEAVYREDVDGLVDTGPRPRTSARTLAGPGRLAGRLRPVRPVQAGLPDRAARGVREEPGPGAEPRGRRSPARRAPCWSGPSRPGWPAPTSTTPT